MYIWDVFLLFVDKDISIADIKEDTNLYDERLVALQRMSVHREKSNTPEIREYIIRKLEGLGIPYEVMPDKREVDGYPSKCDLWSTRDESVLIDAMDCTGEGVALYFKDSIFDYRITFDESGLPDMHYEHKGAIVLRGENETAISRLINNVRLPRVAPSSHCERNEEACSSVKSLMLQLAIFNVSSIISYIVKSPFKLFSPALH